MSKAFLIAAPWSNSGKTTVTLGLARYFKNQGYSVQPFKCGPDYIDTIHHSTAAGRPSVNLDSIMMPKAHLKEVFYKHTSKADISIIEGVMGLFDGAVKDKGSSAEIAKTLDVPVILVVNAKAMAYTIAPILHGLKTFDTEVTIAGVIFNFVKTESHYAFLKEACDKVGIKAIGYLPPNDAIKIPSRHLGLHIDSDFDALIEKASEHISQHISIDEVLNCAKTIESVSVKQEQSTQPKLNIAVAKDEAFTFTYLENLNYLKQLGNVTYFSPIHDTALPEADLIYFAGGYPELYLEQLSFNTAMHEAIKQSADKGVKILAECGGMMYLGKSIINASGQDYPMVNIFNFSTSMADKKLHLGYRKVVFEDYELWGHEFHYSSILNDDNEKKAGNVFTAREKAIDTHFYTYKNVLASYVHLYWGHGGFEWLSSFFNSFLL